MQSFFMKPENEDSGQTALAALSRSSFGAHAGSYVFSPLRKHAYTNILKISPPKTESFQIKILIFFIFRQGGSNEYPQSMFLSRNKKNNVYPCKPQIYYIKLGFKGVNII